MVKLSAKQKMFVREYLIDLNATQASIRAGYSAKTAEQQGPRLLGHVGVAAAIAESMKAREKRIEISQDRVLLELARIAFFDPRKLFDDEGRPKPIDTLDDDTAAAIAGLEVLDQFDGGGDERVATGQIKKYRVADKGQALANAMRHLGMFNDKLDVNLSGPLAERLARARARNG